MPYGSWLNIMDSTPSLLASDHAVLDRAMATPMIDQVLCWSAINSGSHNLAGLARMAEALADDFSSLPGTLQLLDPEPATHIDPNGKPRRAEHGRNLLLTVRPTAPVQLLFTGHMDTVFDAQSPFQSCRWRDPGILNGPGVADMKGGLAVMLSALVAFEHSPDRDRIGYQVVLNSDEEVGSTGSAALLRQSARNKRAAFTYEPSALPDGTLAGARPGSGNFAIVLSGSAAHAGRNPQDGRNAIVAAADLAIRLAAFSRPGLSINCSKIDGGGPTNVVPDTAILRLNMRPADSEAEREATAMLDRTIAQIAAQHEVRIDRHGAFNRPAKPLTPETTQLLALVRDCGRLLGQTIGWQATGGVCDGNNIAACGVPVVDTMGVRGGAIHSEQEFLISDSLGERAALSALVLCTLARG